MILGVFIEFFGIKIVIGLSKNHCDLILTVKFDLSQKTDICRYISDIYQYYFRKSNTCAREIKFRNFAEISGIYDISQYFDDFFDFSPIFLPTDYRLGISFWGSLIIDISA